MPRRTYAKVWWMVRDISERAKENKIKLRKDAARKLLQASETRLEETMIAAGWTVIEDALSKLSGSNGSEPTSTLA